MNYLKVLLLVLLVGCANIEKEFSYQIEEDDFPNPTKIQGTQLLEQILGKLYVNHIDNIIICVTQEAPFFHVFDSDQNHLISFGQKGRGPGEFVIPPIIRDTKLENNSVYLLVDDQMEKKLLTIDIESTINNNEIVVGKKFDYPQKFWLIRDIFFDKNNSFVGIYDDRQEEGREGKTGVFYYNTNLDSVKTFSLFNASVKPFHNNESTSANVRFTGFSQKKNQIVSVMKRFPAMEMLNIETDSLSKKFLLDTDPPELPFDIEEIQNDDMIEYYQYMQVKDKYIYLLYSGYKEKEKKKEQRIRVVDWNGEAIAQFLLPPKYNLSSFDVDEKNRIIYGSSYGNDMIYSFNFSFK